MAGEALTSQSMSTRELSQEHAFKQVAAAMQDVENVLRDVSDSSGPARDVIQHLLQSGGKRIRPRLTLLISASCPGFNDFPTKLAAAGELIHTASLLHDDVIDEGVQRRGLSTARVVWGNTISVLAGDHCLSSAVELIRSVDTGATLSESLKAVKDLVSGELIQAQTRGSLMVDESRYREICRLKTAALFVWCARSGARHAKACATQIDAVGQMAEKVGLAFQMRDDLLDMTGDDRFGKRLLDDLREGRMTLPIIYAVREDPNLKLELQGMFAEPLELTANGMQSFRQKIADSGAIQAVEEEVNQLSEDAITLLSELPRTPYRELIETQVEALGSRSL